MKSNSNPNPNLVDPDELLAAVDIAKMLGVIQSAVSNWSVRDIGFPPPVVRVANGKTPLWLRSDVLRWYANRQGGGSLDDKIKRTEAMLHALRAVKEET